MISKAYENMLTITLDFLVCGEILDARNSLSIKGLEFIITVLVILSSKSKVLLGGSTHLLIRGPSARGVCAVYPHDTLQKRAKMTLIRKPLML